MEDIILVKGTGIIQMPTNLLGMLCVFLNHKAQRVRSAVSMNTFILPDHRQKAEMIWFKSPLPTCKVPHKLFNLDCTQESFKELEYMETLL